MRTRTFWSRSIGAVISAAFVVGSFQLSEPAVADTTPAVANDPTNPETVSAKPLPTTQIDGVAWSQAVIGNTVYVGGNFTTARPAGSAPGVNTVTRSNLLAYDIRTGALLTSWAPSANGEVLQVVASPDGSRVYVGGSFTTINGTTRRRIAAIDATTGALIGNFNPNPDATVSAIAATDSTVYFGGTFGVAGGATRSRLAAWNVAGTPSLLPWAPAAAGGKVAAMTVTPDGSKVVVGGQFTTVNGSSNPGYGMAAIDPTSGALVPWAANSAIRNAGPNSSITSLHTDGDSVYASGFTFGSGGNFEGSARINLDGTINWVDDCHGDTYEVYPRGGAVYKVGHAHYCGNHPGGFAQPNPWRFYRAMAFSKEATGTLRADYLNYANWAGTKDSSILQWFPQLDAGTFTGQTQAAWSITGNSDYVVAGGEFPAAGGTPQQGLVRYAAKNVQPDTLGPELSGSKFVPTVTSPGAGQALVSWQANYDRDSRDLTYKVLRNGTPVYTVKQSSNLWDRPYLNFLDSGQTPGSSVTYRVVVTDPNGNEARSNNVGVTIAGSGATDAYAQAVLKDGPQSYWRLDEGSGSTLADYTGLDPMTAAPGVTQNATGAIDGHGSTTFSGAAGVTAASNTLQEGPWWLSVEGWFQTTSTQGGRIAGFSGTQTGTSATNQYDRHIYMSTSGQLNFGAKQSSNRIVTSPKSYNDGKWHHVVGAIGDSGTSLYVDGVRVGLRTDLRTGASFDGYWRIGGDSLTGWTNKPVSDYFAGNISDVAVYREPLTANQVRNHFEASGRTVAGPAKPSDAYGQAVYNSDPDLFWRLGETTGTALADSSQNGVLGGTLNGTALNGASAINLAGDHSVTTDGVNDYVATNLTINSPAVYSEETWFKTTTTRGGQLIGFGTARAGNSATNNDRDVFMTDSGKVRFAVSPGAVESAIESPGSYNDGTWHHLVASQDSTGMKLYLDGQQVASGPTVNAPDYSGFWRVGGDTLAARASRPTSDYFAGSFDEIAVYRRALSAAEVLSHFTKGGGTEANTAPVAAFTSSEAGLVSSFDGSTSSDPDGSIASYAWDFGDGSTGTGATPSHTYATDGTYQVTLTVTDNRGGRNAVTKPVTVKGNVAPTAAFTSSVNGLTGSFNAAASSDPDGTIASYAWDFGDGSTGTGPTPTHDYATGGTYSVKLTVTDNQGASGTLTNVVTVTAPPVNAKPTAGFTATPTGLTAAFDGSGSSDSDGSIASYSWDFGDRSAAGTGATPSHTYDAAGTYTVTLTVTDDKGATGTVTKDVTVTAPPVNAKPTAAFTSSASGLTAAFDATTSSDSDGTIASYSWDFGDGTTGTGVKPTHDYAAGKTYTVTLTVTDDKGATGTVTNTVTVTAPPPVNARPTAAFTSGTTGLAAAFDATASADTDGTISTYSWDFGDNTAKGSGVKASHDYAVGGTYPVTLTVTDNQGATGTVTRDVTVAAPVGPSVLASDDFTRTVSGGWGTAVKGGAWTGTGTTSNFAVNGGSGAMTMPTANNTRAMTLGGLSAADTDTTVKVSFDRIPDVAGSYAIVGSRQFTTPGATTANGYRAKVKLDATGGTQLVLSRVVGGTETTIRTAVTVPGGKLAAGSELQIRMQTQGTGTTTVRARAWLAGTPEPTTWLATATDTTAALQTTGGQYLSTYVPTGITTTPVVGRWDDLVVSSF